MATNFLPALAYSQTPVTDIDTTSSRTKLYAALNSRNASYKREEYDLDTDVMQLTGVVLKRLDDNTVVKGCRFSGNSYSFPGQPTEVYIDDNEIDGIISILKYITDSVDLTKKPQNNVWIYYKTVDNLEIGARADKGRKFQIYFTKNYRFFIDRSVLLGRLNLAEAYKSFISVRDFLKSR